MAFWQMQRVTLHQVFSTVVRSGLAKSLPPFAEAQAGFAESSLSVETGGI